MKCKARYRGLNPVLGIKRDTEYTLGFTSNPGVNGDEYMWVSIDELPQYLMPYEGIMALVADWDFTVDDKGSMVHHMALEEKWLNVYMVQEAGA